MREIWQRRHAVLAAAWLVLAVPGVLWWRESLIFVILLSLYANFESSLAAHHSMSKQSSEGRDVIVCQGCSDSAGKACEDAED